MSFKICYYPEHTSFDYCPCGESYIRNSLHYLCGKTGKRRESLKKSGSLYTCPYEKPPKDRDYQLTFEMLEGVQV